LRISKLIHKAISTTLNKITSSVTMKLSCEGFANVGYGKV